MHETVDTLWKTSFKKIEIGHILLSFDKDIKS